MLQEVLVNSFVDIQSSDHEEAMVTKAPYADAAV